MKEFVKMTDQEYEALIKKVIAFGEELWKKMGYPFTDDIHIPDELADSDAYRLRYLSYVFNDCKQSGFKKTSGYELLPTWYAYPEMTMGSIGWRMGAREEYVGIFWDYYDSLSEEDQREYDKKYPEPPFYDDDYIEEHWDEINRVKE